MRRGGEPDIGATLRLAHIPGDGITRFAMRKVRSELTRITVLYVLRFVFTPKLATCNNWDGFWKASERVRHNSL